MQVSVCTDYERLSQLTADEIAGCVQQKPTAVLCLAAGDTPRMPYTLLAQKAREEHIDFSQCTFVGLDEWVGIEPSNEGSCHYFLETFLFRPLGIASGQIHLFNAMAGDLQKECSEMDAFINKKGGIDLMVVGVGMNGHIGFNEPGVDINKLSHVVPLDETTQSVGQKYFREATHLQQGITLGFAHLLNARSVILIANGIKKAPIIKKTIEGEISTDIPATIIRKHSHSHVIIDQDAASLLQNKTPPR